MPGAVKLIVANGDLKGEVFAFDQPGRFIVGRSRDCDIRLPDNEAHARISRKHCLINVNPPEATIQDLGSRNGTLVNGVRIGGRPEGREARTADADSHPEYHLRDGDVIHLGGVTMSFHAQAPTSETTGAPIVDQGFSAPYEEIEVEIAEEETVSEPPIYAEIAWEALDSLPRRDGPRIKEPAPEEESTSLFLAPQDFGSLAKPSLTPGYTLLELLAQNPIAEFWSGRDENGREVMIKMIAEGLAEDRSAWEAFFLEGEYCRALNHENVLGALHVGPRDRRPFYVMDHPDAGVLAALIKQIGGPWPPGAAVELTLQILDGLNYLHQRENPYAGCGPGSAPKPWPLVHRALNPACIFLNRRNDRLTARIADAAAALPADAAAVKGQSVKRPKWAAPAFTCRPLAENFAFGRPAYDVWAAAAVLYYLLTYKTPRDFPPEADPYEVLARTEPTPIGRRRDDLPEGLAAVIDQALTEDMNACFANAAAFKNALQAAL